jgi:formylglycine-generating enzyme required for sulfatase activity
VGRNAAGESRHGVRDLVGNGWEWTRTVFAGFPGFTAWARTYPGYSADFFDGKHRVILGASWATDRTLVRRSFRNWFQTQYPYVFAKFRCVRAG